MLQVMYVKKVPLSTKMGDLFDTAISAATLPLVHRDPFDRIIIAEALKENVSVLTKDKTFAEYGCRTLW